MCVAPAAWGGLCSGPGEDLEAGTLSFSLARLICRDVLSMSTVLPETQQRFLLMCGSGWMLECHELSQPGPGSVTGLFSAFIFAVRLKSDSTPLTLDLFIPLITDRVLTEGAW